MGMHPGVERARLSGERVGELIDAARDPFRLRRLQADLALELPHLAVPEARVVVDDIREALRQARGGMLDVSPTARRRYGALELLLDGATPKEAAAAQHVAIRTFYRVRREALEELALVLEQMWIRRTAPTLGSVPGDSGVDSEGIPAPRVFVGRAREVETATELLAQQRMLAVGGPAGIGKTTFAAALAHQEMLLRPVVWHHLRPGLTDSVGGVLFVLARRLSQLRSESLITFLREAAPTSPWQMLAQELAVRAIQEHALAMFIDSAETVAANSEVCGLLASIHEECPAAHIVLVSKERLPLLPMAARIELSGLDADMVDAYMRAHAVSLSRQAVEILTHQTGGSPQLLHLAASVLLHGEMDVDELVDHVLDVADLQTYFFDHIYQQLSESEQLVLGAAALVRGPEATGFLASALDGLTPSIPRTLADLGRRYLLTHGNDGLRLHASIRELIRQILPRGERERLHRRLAQAYQRAGRFDEACHHLLESGDLVDARGLLLANGVDAPPHVRARLLALVDRLYQAGFADDSELILFASRLAAAPDGGPGARSPRPPG